LDYNPKPMGLALRLEDISPPPAAAFSRALRVVEATETTPLDTLERLAFRAVAFGEATNQSIREISKALDELRREVEAGAASGNDLERAIQQLDSWESECSGPQAELATLTEQARALARERLRPDLQGDALQALDVFDRLRVTFMTFLSDARWRLIEQQAGLESAAPSAAGPFVSPDEVRLHLDRLKRP